MKNQVRESARIRTLEFVLSLLMECLGMPIVSTDGMPRNAYCLYRWNAYLKVWLRKLSARFGDSWSSLFLQPPPTTRGTSSIHTCMRTQGLWTRPCAHQLRAVRTRLVSRLRKPPGRSWRTSAGSAAPTRCNSNSWRVAALPIEVYSTDLAEPGTQYIYIYICMYIYIYIYIYSSHVHKWSVTPILCMNILTQKSNVRKMRRTFPLTVSKVAARQFTDLQGVSSRFTKSAKALPTDIFFSHRPRHSQQTYYLRCTYTCTKIHKWEPHK